MYKWSLEKLYKGLDDPRYNEDNLILDQKIKELDELSKHFGKENSKDELERFVNVLEEYQMVVGKLFSFVSLTLATDSTNPLLIMQ